MNLQRRFDLAVSNIANDAVSSREAQVNREENAVYLNPVRYARILRGGG